MRRVVSMKYPDSVLIGAAFLTRFVGRGDIYLYTFWCDRQGTTEPRLGMNPGSLFKGNHEEQVCRGHSISHSRLSASLYYLIGTWLTVQGRSPALSLPHRIHTWGHTPYGSSTPTAKPKNGPPKLS